MNRQLAQILIGATALTGAFFFGSVMQRRHGDLDKTTSPQPMLENEDLVWHSAPDNRSSAAQSDESTNNPPPPQSVAESTAGRPAKPVTEGARQFTAEGSSQTNALERKVVQPDFSRWSTPASESTSELSRPSPMLPLAAPPPLLTETARPQVEPLTQSPGLADPTDVAQSRQAVAPDTATPDSDPWTAPLSSVLLKPSGSNPSLPQLATTNSPAPVVGTASPPVPTEPSTPARLAATELVPVNQANGRKAEVDTDSFRIHVTRPGDTLQSLALKYYGKPDFYLDIYLANQDQLESPIHLPAGKPLKIPDYGK